MARRSLRAFLDSSDGAVAPTVALSLIGLIAAGGIAFDYARLAGMHSELQNAADQAALAAATQLDGKAGAMARATTAANDLVANSTLIAYDGEAPGVGVATITFWQNKAGTTAATSDANAHYVEVTVDGREVFYALTPIVDAVSSGDIDATAMAGLGESICKVPPVMMCNPNESGDPDFTVGNYIGKGLRLVSVGNGGGAWAPGDFGYLDSGDTTNGANGLRKALGWDSVPGDCSPGSGVDTKPGASVSVTAAINTRFDIFDANACVSGGSCSPSANSVKDLIKRDGTNGNACTAGPNGWQEASSRYLPNGNNTLANLGQAMPAAMGHPRDICHAYNGTCNGVANSRVGDGRWDIDAYFQVNYGANHATWAAAVATGESPITVGGGAAPYGVTRYDVYKWEMDNAGSSIGSQTVLGPRNVSGSGANTLRSRGAPYCSPPGITPGGTNPDRRRLSIAVINCVANGVRGNSTNVPVQKWMDVFLVEPSLNRTRTSQGDVYVEVIEETELGGGGLAGQVVQRAVPYLVR